MFSDSRSASCACTVAASSRLPGRCRRFLSRHEGGLKRYVRGRIQRRAIGAEAFRESGQHRPPKRGRRVAGSCDRRYRRRAGFRQVRPRSRGLTGNAEIIRRDSAYDYAPPRMQPNETVHISRRVLLQHESSPTTCLQENLEGRLLHRGHRYEKNGYNCSPVPPSFRHRKQLPLRKAEPGLEWF